jgi:hypothetical protein
MRLSRFRELAEKPDLIFLDSPYFKMKDAQYGDNSISRMDREKYLDFFSELAKACYDAHAERVALLMMDFVDMTGQHIEDGIFIHEYINRFIAAGFLVERIISCNLADPISIGSDLVNKFRVSKRLARQARNLIVFRRQP